MLIAVIDNFFMKIISFTFSILHSFFCMSTDLSGLHYVLGQIICISLALEANIKKER